MYIQASKNEFHPKQLGGQIGPIGETTTRQINAFEDWSRFTLFDNETTHEMHDINILRRFLSRKNANWCGQTK